MSAPSPLAADTSLTTFTIKVKGKPIDSTFQVFAVETWSAVNTIPKARLTLFDGSAVEGDFPISSLEVFLPGNAIEIAAGYNGQESTIFKGVIIRQGLEIDPSQGSKLLVDISDEALKMTLERKNAIFEKMTDSTLIGQLLANSGLGKDIARTSTVHEEIVQYYATDWDLMITRAELNSLVVIVDGGKVTVKKPDTRQAPVLTVAYGDALLSLRAEMDATTQYAQSSIKSYAWDAASQKLVESGPGSVDVQEQGNVSSAQLAKVFDVKKLTQQTGGSVDKPSLQDWSSAELLKSKLSKIRGKVRFAGSAKAQVGKTLTLGGLGKRFNGTAFISGVHHSIRSGKWLTTVDFGLSSRWFAAEAPNVAAPEASGQLPPIKGLQTGIVTKVAKDPGGEFRVFVKLPLLQNPNKGLWARLGGFYASNKVGAVFYPEVNDEVVVGFMNEDPRFPVILGSLYGKKLAPPYPPDEKNSKKGILTRSKLEISFDETNKVIEIRTPGKHVIKLDDKSGAISIQDSNRNTVSLSKGGITLDSASNLKISAKGNITIKAGGNLGMEATANATMKGLQISHKATTRLSCSSSLASEVTASGMLTLRGSLVKIN